MRAIRSLGAKTQCRHKNTKTVTNAGLRRTVCQRCGFVSVDYVEDVFAEEQEQLDRHPA